MARGLDLKRRNRVYYTALAGVFLIVVDTTAAFIAVPSIAAEFGIALPVAQFVVVGYLLVITVCLVPFGRISDLLGRKAMYVTGWGATAAGALAVMLAPSVAVLVVGRFVMGLGAALIQATSMPIVVEAFGADERGRVLGVQMGVVGVGTILGPVFGGLVIGAFGWRSIYLVIGAFSFILALVGQRVLIRREIVTPLSIRAMDPKGMLLLALLLSLFLGTTIASPNLGLYSPWIGAGFAMTVVVGLVFLMHEHRAVVPMVNLNLFRDPTVSLGLLSGVAVFMATASVYFLIPFYAQTVIGLSPTAVGLMLVPGGIVTAVSAPVMGFAADRFGHRRVSLMGQVILGVATAGIATVVTGQSIGLLVLMLMMVSLGLASFHAPNSASIFSVIDKDQIGVASGLINLARNMGNVVGIAVVTLVVTLIMASRGYPPSLAKVTGNSDAGLLLSFVEGMRLGFWIVSALALVLAFTYVLVLRIRNKAGAP